MYVPHLILASMSGVTRPMILRSISTRNNQLKGGKYKLHIQVVDVVIEIAFERIARVKISDGRTQPIGAMNTSVGIVEYNRRRRSRE